MRPSFWGEQTFSSAGVAIEWNSELVRPSRLPKRLDFRRGLTGVSFNCMCMMRLSCNKCWRHFVQFHCGDCDSSFQKRELLQQRVVSVWNPVVFHMCGASHHFDGDWRVLFEQHLLRSDLLQLMSVLTFHNCWRWFISIFQRLISLDQLPCVYTSIWMQGHPIGVETSVSCVKLFQSFAYLGWTGSACRWEFDLTTCFTT